MFLRTTKENINTIREPLLKEDINYYIEIYDEFLKNVKNSGINISNEDFYERKTKLIKLLNSKGAILRNNCKSIVFNSISPSCEDCRTGYGSATYILTLECNRDCFFCVNKNQLNYEKNCKGVNDTYKEFKFDLERYKHMKSVALTGGEPLLYPDKCVEFIEKVKKISKKTQTRIYTNGDLINKDILKQLQESGLDEIRFGIKPNVDGSISNKILKTIENAVRYIPRVIVEMPVIPTQKEEMKILLLKLDKLNIFGINLLEFLYPWVHSEVYSKKNYKVIKRPYEILFSYTYAGGLPIAGSEVVCLELLLFAIESNLKIGIHYCSLENKLTSQIYQHNFNLKLSKIEYFSKKDFFIKTVKGYGSIINEIKNKLDKAGCQHYLYNQNDKYIEFSPIYLNKLKSLNVELGLTYQVVDFDEEGRKVVRQVQIDCINPSTFDKSQL